MDLSKLNDISVHEDIDLTNYTTMRLSARGSLIEVFSIDALTTLLPLLSNSDVEYRILGLGANQIIPESYSGYYIKLKLPFDKSNFTTLLDEYDFPASVSLSYLTGLAKKFGLKGWESFTGVPATLGGAIYMNAGTGLGEIGDIVDSFKVCSSEGILRDINVSSTTFSYRKNNELLPGDVIVSAKLVHNGIDHGLKDKIQDYLEYRNNTQPMWAKTCGCIFKNYIGKQTCRAGQCIDIIGLKGFGLNGIKVSNTHGNFFENAGKGTRSEVLELVSFVKSELYLQFGIKFEIEAEL